MISEEKYIYWKNNKVEVIDYAFAENYDWKDYIGDVCVDCKFTRINQRYGFFDKNGYWQYLPLEQFPAEFRAHLLIMGVL